MKSNPITKAVYAYLSNLESAFVTKDNKQIVFEMNHLKGEANFYDFYLNDILELVIDDTQTGENIFYLHFELLNLEDTINFVKSFFTALNRENETTDSLPTHISDCHKRVLLCCTGGLSTYLFAKKMEEALVSEGIDIKVDATRLSRLDSQAEQYDIILIAPQIEYKFNEIVSKYPNKAVRLDALDFATLNVNKVIHDVL